MQSFFSKKENNIKRDRVVLLLFITAKKYTATSLFHELRQQFDLHFAIGGFVSGTLSVH